MRSPYRITTEEPWFDPRQGQEIFLFSEMSISAVGSTHQPTYRVGTVGFLPVVRRPGSDPDSSPPSSTEISNGWSDTSTPTYISMSCADCLPSLAVVVYLMCSVLTFALLIPQKETPPHMPVDVSFPPAVYFPVFMSNHRPL